MGQVRLYTACSVSPGSTFPGPGGQCQQHQSSTSPKPQRPCIVPVGVRGAPHYPLTPPLPALRRQESTGREQASVRREQCPPTLLSAQGELTVLRPIDLCHYGFQVVGGQAGLIHQTCIQGHSICFVCLKGSRPDANETLTSGKAHLNQASGVTGRAGKTIHVARPHAKPSFRW